MQPLRRSNSPANRWDGAACLDEDPELFFPVGETGAALHQFEFARRVCDTCERRTACLEVAIATDAPHGMWGGTTPEERRRMKRRTPRTELTAMTAEERWRAAELARVSIQEPPEQW